MLIVARRLDPLTVHVTTLPLDRVNGEMDQYLTRNNRTAPNDEEQLSALKRAGFCRPYFERSILLRASNGGMRNFNAGVQAPA